MLISSSCSTDETIVADSDAEVETATSPIANEALCGGNNVKYVKTEEINDDDDGDDSSASLKRKDERMESTLDDISTSLHEIKRAKADISLDTSMRSDTHATSFKDGTGGIEVKKDKVDDYGSGNSDIVYSQNLVVRDINTLTNRISAPNSSLPNFKRFRKVWFGTIHLIKGLSCV